MKVNPFSIPELRRFGGRLRMVLGFNSLAGAALGFAALFSATVPVTVFGRDRMYVLVSPLGIAGPAAIVAFDLDKQGLLTQRESYPIGGGRASESSQELVVHPSGRFLLAPNNVDGSLSVFSINTNGMLNSVSGSPFATGNGPMALAVNPNGQQAYISQWSDATIGVYAFSPYGVLTSTEVVTQN